MKSLHDYRGEYRATCRRYGRAFNRWRRATPWTTERARAYDESERLAKLMFAARDRYHAAINARACGKTATDKWEAGNE